MDSYTSDLIKKIVVHELEKANSVYPAFQCRHTAYGVMLEEFEEAMIEINDISDGILKDYWKKCKESKIQNSTESKEQTLSLLNALYYGIFNAIAELSQLCAMVEKAKNLELKSNDGICFLRKLDRDYKCKTSYYNCDNLNCVYHYNRINSCFDTCKNSGTSMCAYPEICKSYELKISDNDKNIK